jgi:hypothetical protein
MRAPTTHDEWIEAALQARLDQGFSLAIEDSATLDFLANLFGSVDRRPPADGVVTPDQHPATS